MRTRSTSTVLLIALTLLLSACGATTDTTNQAVEPLEESEPATPQDQDTGETMSLEGVQWNLLSLNGADPVQDARIFIEFSDGRVRGLAGCNRYMGTYTQTDGALELSPLGLTRMACRSPEVSQQEHEYTRILDNVTSFQITGNRLVLSTEAGQSLTYESPATVAQESSDGEDASEGTIETVSQEPASGE